MLNRTTVNPATDIRRGYLYGELDLLGILETVAARRPKVLKNGLPNLAFFRAANAALARPDVEAEGVGFVQVEFWLTLAHEAGLLSENDSVLEPSAAADEFFASPLTERREFMRRAWLNSRHLNEFTLTPEIELPGLKKGRTVDVTTDLPDLETLQNARRVLARAAAELTEEITLRQFVREVERQHRNLFINHDDDGSWRQVFYRGIRDRGGRSDLERDGNWDLVEGTVIGLCCALPLAKLGYLAWDPRNRTVAPVGNATETTLFEIIVQPNFEVLAIGDRPDASALWQLARCSQPAHEERVRRYVLERKTFTAALGRGLSAADALALLERLSRSPIPQNVRFSINDWGQMSERIKVWPDALWIEAEGVEDLARALPAGLISRLGAAACAGGHFVCAAPETGVLREVLPARRTLLDYSRRLPPVLAPGPGTELLAPREELHLRARRLLEAIAAPTSADRWQLNADAIVKAGREVGGDALLQRVREAMQRPLTDQQALALSTWSGRFDKPFAGQVDVLLVDNPEQAHLVSELPELAKWLTRRAAPGVFLLRTGGAAAMREVLARLGVTLRADVRERS